MKGASPEEYERLQLTENSKQLQMKDLNYLNQSGCFEINNKTDEVECYKELQESFKVLN